MSTNATRPAWPGLEISAPKPQSLEEQAQIFAGANEGWRSASLFQDPKTKRSPRGRVILLAILLVCLVETGALISNAPSTRLCEEIACRHYFSDVEPSRYGPADLIPESSCKLEVVQSEVASIRGWQDGFDSIIGAILAIPLGVYADSKGRRPALMWTAPGLALYGIWTMLVYTYPDILPLKTLWIASAFFAIGGGPTVLTAILWTMLADVVPENERANTFFKVGVAIMFSEVIAGATSGFLMQQSPRSALYIGWALVFCGLAMIFIFPETLHASGAKEGFVPLRDRDHDHEDGDDLSPLSQPLDSPFEEHFRSKRTQSIRQQLSDLRTIITSSTQMPLLLLTFIMYRMSRGAGSLFLQYISTRYSWSIADVTFLLTARAGLNLILFLIILPLLSRLLVTKCKLAESYKDLLLARISAAALGLGSIGVGFSPTVTILIANLMLYTLGSGFAFLTRSLITSMVAKHNIAKLYTAITLVEALGGMIASPMSAWLFRIGLNGGELWYGLPFFVTGLMFVVTGMIVWFMRVPGRYAA